MTSREWALDSSDVSAGELTQQDAAKSKKEGKGRGRRERTGVVEVGFVATDNVSWVRHGDFWFGLIVYGELVKYGVGLIWSLKVC